LLKAKKSFWGELLIFGLCRRSLWRSFHNIQLRVAAPLPAPPSTLNTPVIFYSNHSSWWDGYLAHIIIRQVYNLNPYLMMDEQQLKKYWFFSWAGCFGVNRQNAREALKSLEYIATELPQKAGRSLWMFPQGEITPQEARPLGFHSGLAYLIRRLGNCYVYPVSLRYEFMREQYPDIFVSVGPALHFEAGQKIQLKGLTTTLEQTLIHDLATLREDVSQQRLDNFVTILRGKGSTDTSLDAFFKLFKKSKI